MSHSRKIKQPDSELNFDIEIMKVKQEQLEKRLDLLEKTLSFYERTHRAEMMTLFSQNRKQQGSITTLSSDSEEEINDDTSVESEKQTNTNISESRRNLNSHLRTVG